MIVTTIIISPNINTNFFNTTSFYLLRRSSLCSFVLCPHGTPGVYLHKQRSVVLDFLSHWLSPNSIITYHLRFLWSQEVSLYGKNQMNYLVSRASDWMLALVSLAPRTSYVSLPSSVSLLYSRTPGVLEKFLDHEDVWSLEKFLRNPLSRSSWACLLYELQKLSGVLGYVNTCRDPNGEIPTI